MDQQTTKIEGLAEKPALARRAVLLGAVAVLAIAGTLRFSDGLGSEDVSQAEIHRRLEALQAQMPLHLSAVAADEMAEAWRSLGLSLQEQQALQAAVTQGRTRLAWLSLYDSGAEDGDVVTVESFGLTCTVPLLHAPTRIAIPLAPTGHVRIIGADEGKQRGVTAGILSGGRPIKLPPIRKGQVIVLSVVAP